MLVSPSYVPPNRQDAPRRAHFRGSSPHRLNAGSAPPSPAAERGIVADRGPDTAIQLTLTFLFWPHLPSNKAPTMKTILAAYSGVLKGKTTSVFFGGFRSEQGPQVDRQPEVGQTSFCKGSEARIMLSLCETCVTCVVGSVERVEQLQNQKHTKKMKSSDSSDRLSSAGRPVLLGCFICRTAGVCLFPVGDQFELARSATDALSEGRIGHSRLRLSPSIIASHSSSDRRLRSQSVIIDG